MSSKQCAELVVRCFSARTEAHMAHLTTKSYAEHKALSEFYDSIVGLADDYAEACQGRNGLLKFQAIIPRVGNFERPVTIPTELQDWIDAHRADCGDDSELQNIIDEINQLCGSTLYKLRFLS